MIWGHVTGKEEVPVVRRTRLPKPRPRVQNRSGIRKRSRAEPLPTGPTAAGGREKRLVGRNAPEAGEQGLKCHSELDSIKLQV